MIVIRVMAPYLDSTSKHNNLYRSIIGQILSVAFGIRPAAGDIFHLTYQFFPSDILAAGSLSVVEININNRLYYILYTPTYRVHYSYYFFFDLVCLTIKINYAPNFPHPNVIRSVVSSSQYNAYKLNK